VSRLKCGCRYPFDPTACSRDATQEDLLCDQCREGRHLNAVFIGEQGHHHIDVSNVTFPAGTSWSLQGE
jgi:hypothetical protein